MWLLQSRMIFIVGNSRSGTTMMARILGRNKKIKMFRELHFFEELWNPNSINQSLSDAESRHLFATLLSTQRDGYMAKRELGKWMPEAERLLKQINKKEMTAPVLLDVFLANELILCRAEIGIEQTPRNIFYLKEIIQYFPNALIVEMVRDPRDILLSKKNKWKRGFLSGGGLPWRAAALSWANYHPVITAKLWCSAIRAGENLKDPRIHRISFEQLIEDPEPIIRRICEEVNLIYDPDMLDVPQIGSSLRADTSSTGLNKNVIGRWREGGLTSTEIFLCQRETKNEMETLGYKLVKAKPNYFVLMMIYCVLPIKLFAAFIMNFSRLTSIKEAIKRRVHTA